MLEILIASTNSITIIPEDVNKMNSLKKLDLGFNKITVIPYTVGSMRTLKVLNIILDLIHIHIEIDLYII